MPLQGVRYRCLLPRVSLRLPWAVCLLPFQGVQGPMYDTPPIAITFVPKALSIRNTKCGLRHKNVATSCEKNLYRKSKCLEEGNAVNLALLASDSALADKASASETLYYIITAGQRPAVVQSAALRPRHRCKTLSQSSMRLKERDALLCTIRPHKCCHSRGQRC